MRKFQQHYSVVPDQSLQITSFEPPTRLTWEVKTWSD